MTEERDELLDHVDQTGQPDHYPIPGPGSDRPEPNPDGGDEQGGEPTPGAEDKK